jgi:tetratricopeptide (TPR) repeat protein
MIRSIAMRALFVIIAAATMRAQCGLDDKRNPAELVNPVQELAVRGNWKGAQEVTEQNLRSCQSGQEGSSCRKLNNFTLGFLAQREALDCNLQGAARRDLLQQALTSYKNALTEPPADGSTLNNLAVVEQELGDTAEATHAWQQAIELDSDAAWLYALRLGDLYLSENHLEEARSQYERSGTLSPDSEAPHERLVETYRKATDSELQQLAPALFQMEGLFPRVARTGYELIMAREYSEQPDKADQALVRWTLLTSRQGWISADSLDALPQNWKTASVTELRKYWEDPATSSPPWHWWLATNELRHVVLDVALVAGRQLVNDQQPQEAIRCWETALQFAKDLRGNGPAVPLAARGASSDP